MLTHYIIVRRDIPLGVLAAMVTHVAGESGALYQDSYDGRFRGARAVVLEVKNELALYKAGALLFKHDIQFVDMKEHGGPYDGQYMAIGLVPVESDVVEAVLRPFQTLKELDKPTETTYDTKITENTTSGPLPDATGTP